MVEGERARYRPIPGCRTWQKRSPSRLSEVETGDFQLKITSMQLSARLSKISKVSVCLLRRSLRGTVVFSRPRKDDRGELEVTRRSIGGTNKCRVVCKI